MSSYKAVIFDLDGTAIPNVPNGLPSEILIKAVAENKRNIKLCAATGRSLTMAKAILDALNLDEPCVISAGTQIVDPKTGEILWEASIEKDDIAKILDICKPYRYEMLFRNELVGEGSFAADRVVNGHVNVIYVMGCSEADATAILEQLGNIASITAASVTSWTHESIDIHITHRNATKEHAIAELLRVLGLNKKDVVGVGDGNNDTHLFKAVGHKVAMGNATDLLKSQADEVIDTVDHDGLAKFIEQIVT